MRCRDQPITCRGKVAEILGLTPRKDKPWQFDGPCPVCHHGGFGLGPADQVPGAPRHLWYCNCHRCGCSKYAARVAMLDMEVSEHCLGTYASKPPSSAPEVPRLDEASVLRRKIDEVLHDPSIRALADLKIRIHELSTGREAPKDWAGFLAFIDEAGVQRSKRYDAAERWGRSATAVVQD